MKETRVGDRHGCGGEFRRLYARGPKPLQAYHPFPALGCDRCGVIRRLPKSDDPK